MEMVTSCMAVGAIQRSSARDVGFACLAFNLRHVERAGRTALEPRIPETTQVLDLLLLRRAFELPVAQGLANDFARGGVVAGIDRGADVVGDFFRECDGDFFDGRHSGVRYGYCVRGTSAKRVFMWYDLFIP
ncbi:hypothetical protein THIOKS13320022 [Thiocapsa sp. KS1]|nr:hypothetical protein THIOKS13320022 [Thiocapsa sp. KS1]